MKIRNIPFGYRYEDGRIVLNETESAVVKEISQLYLDGKSLLNIAGILNARKIEYRPGIIGWNRARIKHIIDNQHYMGDEKFPPIIEESVYRRLREIKSSKNTQGAVDRTSWIFQLNVPVRCPKCGNEMYRKTYSTLKTGVRWYCKGKDCTVSIDKNDDELLAELLRAQKMLIEFPDLIEMSRIDETEDDLELQKLNLEITRLLNGGETDKKIIQKKLLKYAAKSYETKPPAYCRNMRIKDIYREAGHIQEFSMDIFEKTVVGIAFHANGTVGMILENNQEICAGVDYGK